MVQKINPHPAPGCNRSPPYYVFSKDAIIGTVPSISSEVLALSNHSLPEICVSQSDSGASSPSCLSPYLLEAVEPSTYPMW